MLRTFRAVPWLVLLVLIPAVAVSGQTTQPTPDPFAPETTAESTTNPDTLITRREVRGQTIQAIYQVEAQAAANGWTRDLRRRAGNLYFALDDYDRAAAHWETIADEDAFLTRQLAGMYLDRHRWADAETTLERLVELTPDDPWASYQLGLLLATYDPAAAAPYLERASTGNVTYSVVVEPVLAELANTPTTGRAGTSMRVGLALVDAGLWPQAELAFRHAALVGRPFPEALAYVAYARDNQGKDSTDWIVEALTVGPNSAQVWYLTGLHLRQLRDYAASRDAFVNAAAIDPNNAAYYAELGEAYVLLNNLEQAEYWLRVALSVSENSPEFEELLALFYADTGYNSSAGLNILREVTASDSNNPDVLAGYGWALHNSGMTSLGLAEIGRALTLDPNNDRALYYRGLILIDIGQVEEGAQLLAQVAETDSDFATAARTLLDQITAPDE